MDKIKILYMVPFSFNDNIFHAGGQTINFYFKNIYNSKDCSTAVLCLDDLGGKELKSMTQDYGNSNFYIDSRKKNIGKKAIDYLKFNYVYPYLKRILPAYYSSNGFNRRRLLYLGNELQKSINPDIIIIEHTSLILWSNEVKSLFPNSKLVASCHDISFLSVTRKFKNKNNLFYKWYVRSFKQLEKNALLEFHLVITHNEKDKDLAKNSLNIETHKLHSLVAYYKTYQLDNNSKKDSIIFFGHMAREENNISIIWFIENTWLKLTSLFPTVKLVVIGGGVTQELKNKCKPFSNIILTGFVDDPTNLFSSAYAMIAPLQLGAGIKVKSLEAMASGIPLIANTIGIEGINATNNKEYVHAETPEEWISAIENIVTNHLFRTSLIEAAKQLIHESYSLEESFILYKKRLLSLLKENNCEK